MRPGAKEDRKTVRGMGRIFTNKGSRNLYIAYSHHGVEHRESCGSPREADARRRPAHVFIALVGAEVKCSRDRLLPVAEAADRLACTTDWLYRHHHRLPFAVRTGRQVRFSADGLDRYIRQRAGRESTSRPLQRER